MSDLGDLYQEVILDHGKRPRNFGEIESADGRADGFNPLCGDKVTVFLKVDDGRVSDVRFKGTGCAISTASASIMTEVLRGKSRSEVQRLFDLFHGLVTGRPKPDEAGDLGKLEVFSGVSEFPARVKCATLAWHTMLAGLKGTGDTVTTE